MLGFCRIFHCAGVSAPQRVHCSFPLGIHPAGQMMARAAEKCGMAVLMAGAGTTTLMVKVAAFSGPASSRVGTVIVTDVAHASASYHAAAAVCGAERVLAPALLGLRDHGGAGEGAQ